MDRTTPSGGLLDFSKFNATEIARMDLVVAGQKQYIGALQSTIRMLLEELPLTGDASVKAVRERAERILGGALS